MYLKSRRGTEWSNIESLGKMFAVLVGLSLGAFPPAGVVVLSFVGLIQVWSSRMFLDRGLEVSIFVFALVRGFHSWRIDGNWILGLGEGTLAWLLFRGAAYLSTRERQSLFVKGLFVGLLVVFGGLIVSLWKWAFEPLPWFGVAKVEQLGLNRQRFVAVDEKESYVYRHLGVQGPGRVSYSISLRSNMKQIIRIGLNHTGNPPRAASTYCSVIQVWQVCTVQIVLNEPGELLAVIGGENTFRFGATPIEAQDGFLTGGIPIPLIQLGRIPRLTGWSFNPNGLGAWMAVLGILILVLSRSQTTKILIITFSLLAIILSGSRNALFSFFIAFITTLAIQSKRSAFIFGLSVLFIGVSLQATGNFLPNLRAFGLFYDPNLVPDRNYLFKQSLEAFLGSPLIGVGDLSGFIQRRMSFEATHLGFDTHMLTHAHNLLLQIAGESGIIGLVTIVLIWYFSISRIIRNRDFTKIPIFLCIALLNTVDFLFFYSPVQETFWLAVGLSIAPKRAEARTSTTVHGPASV